MDIEVNTIIDPRTVDGALGSYDIRMGLNGIITIYKKRKFPTIQIPIVIIGTPLHGMVLALEYLQTLDVISRF